MPFMAKNAVFKKLAEISDIRTLSKKEMDKYDCQEPEGYGTSRPADCASHWPHGAGNSGFVGK